LRTNACQYIVSYVVTLPGLKHPLCFCSDRCGEEKPEVVCTLCMFSAWDNTILKAFRGDKNSIMPVQYPLTQLLQECATWKLPNYCHWETIKKTFKL